MEVVRDFSVFQRSASMVTVAAWIILSLGIIHCLLGLAWFKKPIGEAINEGFFGKFQGIEPRRLAFWFTIFGPLLIMSGHIALYAASESNLSLLRLIGFYLVLVSLLGVMALPKSPFWATLILAPVLIAGGFGVIA
jgi:hypothetical protein